jgi:signal transduction histidine kinase
MGQKHDKPVVVPGSDLARSRRAAWPPRPARQVSVLAPQREQAEVGDAGARLVAAADRERRRLERDLHDGAQQRLVSLSARLRLLASRLPPGSEAERLLAEARTELAASLQELRDLARGIHPATLSARGLAAALEALTARAPLPVELLVEPGGRAPEPVELAAYYLVAEALTNILRHSEATSAGVSVAQRGTWLVVEVADDGAGGADRDSGSGLRGLTDRIEALGGRLEVSSPAGVGTTLRAEIPLEQRQVEMTDRPQAESCSK